MCSDEFVSRKIYFESHNGFWWNVPEYHLMYGLTVAIVAYKGRFWNKSHNDLAYFDFGKKKSQKPTRVTWSRAYTLFNLNYILIGLRSLFVIRNHLITYYNSTLWNMLMKNGNVTRPFPFKWNYLKGLLLRFGNLITTSESPMYYFEAIRMLNKFQFWQNTIANSLCEIISGLEIVHSRNLWFDAMYFMASYQDGSRN